GGPLRSLRSPAHHVVGKPVDPPVVAEDDMAAEVPGEARLVDDRPGVPAGERVSLEDLPGVVAGAAELTGAREPARPGADDRNRARVAPGGHGGAGALRAGLCEQPLMLPLVIVPPARYSLPLRVILTKKASLVPGSPLSVTFTWNVHVVPQLPSNAAWFPLTTRWAIDVERMLMPADMSLYLNWPVGWPFLSWTANEKLAVPQPAPAVVFIPWLGVGVAVGIGVPGGGVVGTGVRPAGPAAWAPLLGPVPGVAVGVLVGVSVGVAVSVGVGVSVGVFVGVLV